VVDVCGSSKMISQGFLCVLKTIGANVPYLASLEKRLERDVCDQRLEDGSFEIDQQRNGF